MSNRYLWLLGVVLVGSVLAIQQHSLQQLRSEQKALGEQLGQFMSQPETDGVPTAAGHFRWKESASTGDVHLDQRLVLMEDELNQLRRAAEHLMQRGQVPLSPSMVEETRRKFFDTGANGWDRLQALRLLRRNKAATDDVLEAAVAWLPQSTNPDLTDNIMEQLDGLTNSFLRAPLLQLATTASNTGVRQRAIQNLRKFVGDPEVEALLWKALTSDGNGDVRNQARDSLQEDHPGETRIASLQQRAANTQGSFEERLTALEILKNAEANVSAAAAEFAATAASSQDAEQRSRFFSVLQDMTDPALMPVLVLGVQDANAGVRQRAVRALTGHKADATALQWLQYLAQSDPDQRVRRAASRALGQRE